MESNQFKSKRNILLVLDMISVAISFFVAIGIRYKILINSLGSELLLSTYVVFFLFALLLFIVVFLLKRAPRIDRMSYKEIIFTTVEQQTLFVAMYVVLFFLFRRDLNISRVVIGLFYLGNIFLCSLCRIIYHNYLVTKNRRYVEKRANLPVKMDEIEGLTRQTLQHVYILGAKSIGLYGGFESFVMSLLQHHKDNKKIKYHIACKASGYGSMDLEKIPGTLKINDQEFTYCNAHCFLIDLPDRIGQAQAIFYDIAALKWICNHVEKNHISRPIVYILASRIGPFEKKYVRRIHDAGGLVYQNPDGHESWRRKYSLPVRKYWKFSERYAIKNADLVICDSKSMENYIKDEYSDYNPKTKYIAYGSEIPETYIADDDPKYTAWLADHNLTDKNFYVSVGRFVPENNYDTMIREFMKSHTDKDLAIVTTDNEKYEAELRQKLQYQRDSRIKFVGTVYDTELMNKIRKNACGNFHGHEVGGTNPSLLEALANTDVNMIYDIDFNREVAEDAALYWTKEEGSLSQIIDKADKMSPEKKAALGEKAKQRVKDDFTWEYICDQYAELFGVDKME